MNKSNIIKQLDYCIKNEYQCTIERPLFDEYPIHCLPIKRSEQLVLVHYMYDFSFDGFKIVRLNDITSLIRSETEMFSEKICKSERILPPASPDIDVSDYKTAFEQFLNKNIEVECEAPEVNTFNIGKVIKVTDKQLEICRFDALCVWDKDNTLINIEDISCVSFGNRYLNILSKHAENGN